MDNNFNIKDKVCVITGGSGVLGGEVAAYLLKQKAKVVILGSNQERLDAKLAILSAIEPNNVIGYVCSVIEENEVKETSKKILEKWGCIDVLINAAGGNMPGATISEDKTIFDLELADFDKVSNLNLKGTLIPSLVFGKHMAKQGKGVILNYSSMAVYQAITRVIGYSSSKAAVTNLTQWMAMEFAIKFGDKLRVNAIAPGFFVAQQNSKLLLLILLSTSVPE